jgi:division protein CdvB (Snf7/Vps24/ESCRT-III family)
MKKEKLPDGSKRVMALVEKSRPNGQRPRMSSEFEAQLAEVDAQSAACYASMEDLSDKLDTIAQAITEEESVVVMPLDDEDSAVHHLDDVSTELRSSQSRLAAAAPGASPPRPTVRPPRRSPSESDTIPPSPRKAKATTHH